MKKFIVCVLIIILFSCRFLLRSEKIKVYNHVDDKVIQMDFEQYIMHVLAAEMGTSFEIEALKAQAVAARTYTVQKIASGWNDPYHKGADICTDSSHCQAYKDLNGLSGDFQKIRSAVDSTSGEIIMYNNEPIRAVFHSASHGWTERSADVWVEDLPYLQSVESPWDSLCPDYIYETSFSKDEICSLLDTDNTSIEKITRSSAGGIMNIVIGGKEMKGTEVRSKLNLRSTCFTVTENGNDVIFRTEGYGHGLGLSQWGAQGMAKEGASYKDILVHYYNGTTIKKVKKTYLH